MQWLRASHGRLRSVRPGSTHPARPPRRRTRRPMNWAFVLCIVVVYPTTTLLFRIRTRHADRIPATGGALLVANHVSVLDPLSFARMVFDAGRLPRLLGKAAVFRGLAGTILRAAGHIPVHRDSSHASSSIIAARQALADGEIVVIYPEGSVTRDPAWWPMQARTGVARLALTTDVPVIPVAQWGPQRVHDYQAKKLHLRLRTPVEHVVGEPVDLTALRAEVRAGRPLTTDLLREVTDLLMTRVRDQLAEIRQEDPPVAFHARPPRSPSRPGDGPSAPGGLP